MKYMKPLLILAGSFLIFACNNNSSKTDETSPAEVMEEVSILGQETSYTADTLTMNGYIAYDASTEEPRPGVLVVHEWWGHNDYARKRADMLAELGYVALAVDMYGDGKQADHPQDAGTFAGMVMSDISVAKARFEAAMDKLKENKFVDTTKMAAIGYCFGGSVVLSMANAGYDLDAVAAFHSGVQLPVAPSEDIKAKILVANGADDPFIPGPSVDAFKEAMDKVGADYEYIAYEGVVHSFTNPGADTLGEKFELPTRYDPTADEDSWSKMQMLFDSVF